jgi:hypothetical protein
VTRLGALSLRKSWGFWTPEGRDGTLLLYWSASTCPITRAEFETYGNVKASVAGLD